jgi:hypothetical protein
MFVLALVVLIHKVALAAILIAAAILLLIAAYKIAKTKLSGLTNRQRSTFYATVPNKVINDKNNFWRHRFGCFAGDTFAYC